MAQDGRLQFRTGLDNSQLKRDAKEVERTFQNIEGTAKESGGGIENAFLKAGKAVAVFFTAQQAMQFSSQIIKVRGEIQQLEIALDTMLGSAEKRGVLMNQLIESAATTPFGLTEIAQGAKQLLAYGTSAEKVNESLMMLGNIASGLSIPLNDLVYLYGTTMVQGRAFTMDIRQFQGRGIPLLKELAKQMGVTETAVNEMVTAGQIGFDKVESALQGMTSKGGQFENLMQKQSKGIVGQWANIQDGIQMAMNEIGESQEGLINSGLEGISELVDNYEKIGKIIASLVATYGAYKGAVIAVNLVNKASASINAMVIASNGVFNKSLAAQWVLTEKLQKAKALLNKTMLLNPYVLAATLVLGLVTALIIFRDKTTSAERAMKSLNDRVKEHGEYADSEREAVERLTETIKNETSTRAEKQSALERLKKMYPSIFDDLDMEKVKNMELADAIRGVNVELERKGKLSDNQRVTEIDTELERLRSEDGTTAYAGMYKYSIDHSKRIGDLEKERLFTMERIRKQKELEEKAEFEALTTKEKVAHLESERLRLLNEENILRKAGVRGDELEKMERAINANKIALDGYKEQLEKTGVTAKQEITSWLSQLKELEEQEKKINADASLSTAERTERLKKIEEERKSLSDSLKSRGYSPDKGAGSTAERVSTLDMERESREAKERQKTALYELQQQSINLMKEGTEKEIEQLRLDYDMKKHAIDIAQQDELDRLIDHEKKKAEVSGGKFDASSVRLDAGVTSIYDEARSLADETYMEGQKKLFNELLDKYKTYEEQRAEITQKYSEERTRIESENVGGRYDEKLKVLNEKEQKELSEFDTLIQDKTSITYQMFADMREKSIEELRRLQQEAEGLLSFLSGGEWDSDKGASFGITEAQFNDIIGDPEKLAQFRTGLGEIRNEILSLDNPIGNIKTALKDLFDPKNAGTNKAKQAFQIIEQSFTDIMRTADAVGSAVGDIFSSFGNDEVGETVDSILGIASGAGQAAIGVGKIASGDIIGGMKDLAKGVANVVTNIAKMHDAEKERKIQEAQRKIEALDEAYKTLGESVETAYSKDASKMIEQQNVMLKQQQILLRQQIAEEKSKKRTDKDKIKEWESTLADIDKQIAENKEKAVDAIFGEDVKSAIDNFASAWLSAWSSGEDKAKGMKDVVKKMIKNIISEMIKSDLSGTIAQLRERINSYLSDGIIDAYEEQQLDKIVEQKSKELDNKYGWADRFIRDAEEQGDATYGQYEKITQEQASSIDGRLTGIHTESVTQTGLLMGVGDSLKEMRNVALDSLTELISIRKNTALLSETNELLRGIKKGTDTI